MTKERERLGSRLGFILLSAGCAIGCGNVWKFPWMTGEYGGGAFVLVYLICLLILGLPVMTMEFSVGRAAQTSQINMYQKLEKKGQKWHYHGIVSIVGNVSLMAFYTVVTGWMICYFWRFLTGDIDNLGFVPMITNAGLNVTFLAIAVIAGFVILCFDLQKGLESVTKYMMVILLFLMVALAIHSATLPGAGEGLRFYLLPDLSKLNGTVIVNAMNQAFFTLSIGMGSMAIFGSYIGKDHSLMGESVRVIGLDTFAALMAGFIMFPACATFNIPLNAGPSLLFDTMATVFKNMNGGRFWGTLFFLFMVFAAFSTELTVCESIVAMVRDLTGWDRKKSAVVSGVGVFLLALTTALGYSKFHFQPFAEGTAWLDFWDFIVSTNILPLGGIVFSLFCCNKFGWGWDNFIAEANAGNGMKVKSWMKPIFRYVVPTCVAVVYIYGIFTFPWK
ncbi:MAG: sodium-dependent transporter [Sphaerochaetaceae bacterium]|nr:sodium-dependent transporter [Sphaerochaetaceae bacterium]